VLVAALVWYGKSRTLDETEPPPASVATYNTRPEWRDYIPWLYQAAALPQSEGVRLLLQHDLFSRTYAAIEILRACHGDNANIPKPADPVCKANLGDEILESAITKKIDNIIATRTRSDNTLLSVDCSPDQPFPVDMIVAMRSRGSPYACLSFQLPVGNGTTVDQIERRYGTASDRSIDAQGFDTLTYRSGTSSYDAKTYFRFDSVTGELRRVMISVDRRYRRF